MDITELHNALLRLLIKFDSLCRKHNIKYSIGFGTMLGAIRHKGFIPWDDDVDIMITRDEYEKFCKIPCEEFGEDFFFQNVQTDSGYPYNTARLRLNNSSMIYDKWVGAGFHQGVYIDIITMDNLPGSKTAQIIQKAEIIILTPFRFARNRDVFFCCGRNVPLYIKKPLYSIIKHFPLAKMYEMEVKIEKRYNDVKTSSVCFLGEGNLFLKKWYPVKPIPRIDMERIVDVPFETVQLMCSANYDSLLRYWYGDYMKLPPVEEQRIYHQPKYFSSTVDYREYLAKGC